MNYTGFSFRLDDELSKYRFDADLTASKIVCESLGYQRNSPVQNFRLTFDDAVDAVAKVAEIMAGIPGAGVKSGRKPEGREPGWSIILIAGEERTEYYGTSAPREVLEIRNRLIEVSDPLVDSLPAISGTLDMVRLYLAFEGGSCRYEYRRGMSIATTSYSSSGPSGCYYAVMDGDQEALSEVLASCAVSDCEGAPGGAGEFTAYFEKGYVTIRCAVFEPAWWPAFAESLAERFEELVHSDSRPLL